VSQVRANPLVRVVALMEPAALLRWAASAAVPLESTSATQLLRYPELRPMSPEAPSRRPDASRRIRMLLRPKAKLPGRQGFRRYFGTMPEFGRENEGRMPMSDGKQ
jgi:hypothetical protein